jgi:hypothetical protein
MSPLELQSFYEDLVRQLRNRGVVCAITSGLACVHYGVAESTKDCDLLCQTSSFGELLALLSATRVGNEDCSYRGNISPPLDARWHRGGWTSHFEWDSGEGAITLDVFGHALRESFPWGQEILGLYANPRTVAEMKRTNRDKDWAFVTALGVRMLEAGDEQGWLHIFNADTLMEWMAEEPCPPELASRRPALVLARERDPRTTGALNAERRFWEELDRRRIKMLEESLKRYVSAVRKARAGCRLSLPDEHAIRVELAERHLPQNPLKDYGLQKFINEAKDALVRSAVVPENALTWLPDVAIYFDWLNK